MSELKDYDIMDIEAVDDERLKTESASGKWVPCSRVYLKSEADKVIAEKDKEIAELNEERRWRKFPDEKPSEEGYYIICGSSGFRNADKWTYCKDRQKMDFSFYSYGVAYWMPLPKAPKEEK